MQQYKVRPVTGGWEIIDLVTGRVVHSSQDDYEEVLVRLAKLEKEGLFKHRKNG